MSRLKLTLWYAVPTAILVAAIFLPAGRLDLPHVWAYVLILLLATLFAGLFMMDPDLRQERLHPGKGEDSRLRIVVLPFFLAHLVIAGLDVGRLHFSDSVPLWARVAGLAGLAGGFAWISWAVRVNRFFSPVVRIQSERGHHLVTNGPYRFVRHPGYLGSLLMCAASALALGSWWAMVPLVVPLSLLVRRTVLEDRFLHRELAGYTEYAARVRYRLVPGIW
jgi:protein-S-isoprenylcysteine O-methyltransferase Ste14